VCQKKQAGHFACICSALRRVANPAANAAAAPFVGKCSRANVHHGALLCGAGYWRESAPEKPLIGIVPFPAAN